MTGEIKISVRAYANQLHVDEKAVRKAISDGKIKKGYDVKTKKITASVATKEWGFLHKNPKPQRGVSKAKVIDKLKKKNTSKDRGDNKKNQEENQDNPEILNTDLGYLELISKIKLHPDLQYSEVVRRKEILSAATDRMKLEEMNGSLVRKDEVNKALYAIGDQLKKAILNLPNRITGDIRNAANETEARTLFDIELNQLLTNISALALP